MDEQSGQKIQEPGAKPGEHGEWDDHLTATLKGVRRDIHRMKENFPSPEFRKHARAARREMLLAFRSLLDDAIARLEDKPKNNTQPQAGRIKVE